MDQTETLGLGQLAEKIEELARAGTAHVDTLALPDTALPPGLLVAEPRLLVITGGDGKIRIESLAPHIDALRGKPARRRGTATATTLDSFCDLVNRNGDDESVIFLDANWRKPKLTAVLNYNRYGEVADAHTVADAGDDPLARFGDHRIVYDFPLSEPWKAWVKQDGEAMGQGEFAAFLEDHIHEIAAESDSVDERRWKEDFRTTIAAPNDLVDLARGLEIHVGEIVKSKVRLASGETEMVFETEHRAMDGGKVSVPGLFILNVPVFYRGEVQRMPVRLRYRVKEGAMVWFYKIFRPDEFVDTRIRADVEQVVDRTGRLVLDGAPEVG